MTKCPECDEPMEYDEDSDKYYCPKCEKHFDPVEAQPRKTIYQDRAENPMPDTIFYWDEDARAHEHDEESEDDEEKSEE